MRYLVKHPGDVEGLRYLMRHLWADMYRVYTGQAGALIAEPPGGSPVRGRLSTITGRAISRNGAASRGDAHHC